MTPLSVSTHQRHAQSPDIEASERYLAGYVTTGRFGRNTPHDPQGLHRHPSSYDPPYVSDAHNQYPTIPSTLIFHRNSAPLIQRNRRRR
jgi:hypothetical protein